MFRIFLIFGKCAFSATLALLLLLTPHNVGAQSVVIYSFKGGPEDGKQPQVGLVRDVRGNIYGTTAYGGWYGKGIVFKLAPDGSETVLHSFSLNGSDGAWPWANLTRDSAGNLLYGTTTWGGKKLCKGSHFGCGTIFRVER